MKKLTSCILLVGMVSLLWVFPSFASTTVSWMDMPFRVTHLRIVGNHVYLAGTTTVYDKIAGQNVDIVDMGIGVVIGNNINLTTYWNPPQRDTYTIFQQYEKSPIKAVAYINGKLVVATLHSYYIWNISSDVPKEYGNGAGVDDMSVVEDVLYATRLNVMGKINMQTGEFVELTREAQMKVMSTYDVDAAMYIVFPYKEHVVSLGTGAILFFSRENGQLKLLKSYVDKKVEGIYDLDPDSALQGGYTVWNHYVFLPDKHYNIIRIVDLDTGDSFAVDVPDSIYRVASDDKYLYGATEKGKIFSFSVDISHKRLGILWQVDLKKPVYSIAASEGHVFVATGEKKIAVISGIQQFSDVPINYWAHDAIKYLAEKGIINGYPGGTFKPEHSVTRAEFAKMLATAMNLKLYCDDTLPEIYKDVHAGDWYCKYITPVVKVGYMKGYGKGFFGPNDKVKKEEILTTIVRIKGWKLVFPETPSFPDVPKKHWSYPYIETALLHDIVKVKDPHITDGRFHLGVPATRAQTAVFIYRMKK